MGDRPFPASVDRSKYAALYLVNSGGDFFATDDLTQLPVNKTEVPYLLTSSNRCGAGLESPIQQAAAAAATPAGCCQKFTEPEV